MLTPNGFTFARFVLIALLIITVLWLLEGCSAQSTQPTTQQAQVDITKPFNEQPAHYQQGFKDALDAAQKIVAPIPLDLMLQVKLACQAKYKTECGMSFDNGFVPLDNPTIPQSY